MLLVDDEPDLLNLTAFVLEQSVAIVQIARSAAALERLQSFQPDVLLSDLAMPAQDVMRLVKIEIAWMSFTGSTGLERGC